MLTFESGWTSCVNRSPLLSPPRVCYLHTWTCTLASKMTTFEDKGGGYDKMHSDTELKYRIVNFVLRSIIYRRKHARSSFDF